MISTNNQLWLSNLTIRLGIRSDGNMWKEVGHQHDYRSQKPKHSNLIEKDEIKMMNSSRHDTFLLLSFQRLLCFKKSYGLRWWQGKNWSVGCDITDRELAPKITI
jgi:hypothetical protein